MLPAQGEGRGSRTGMNRLAAFLVILCVVMLCALVAIK
jgi:hypothetical protein